ncbi:hypothetical protein AA313_de0206367 [Arthrobotrys entomopaga]|nr:hypothetical protein AA313_de0206367 [Arthrobotrys entomopaga]
MAYPERRKHTDYTVGWLCAFPEEYEFSVAMLDSIHENPHASLTGRTEYTLGEIEGYNIAIACLRLDRYQIPRNASLARILSAFPAVEFVLMVGTGSPRGTPPAFAPGDVLVGVPTASSPAALDWGSGTRVDIDGRILTRTVLLNDGDDLPSNVLLVALSKLNDVYASYGTKIPWLLEEMGRKYPSMESTYLNADRLRVENFERVQRGLLETRISPRVHFSLLASGAEIIENAVELQKDSEDTLCTKTEVASISKDLQCIIVRGIHDDSDSQKDNRLRKHAAAVAAAFAKEMLVSLPPTKIKREAFFIQSSDVSMGDEGYLQSSWYWEELTQLISRMKPSPERLISAILVNEMNLPVSRAPGVLSLKRGIKEAFFAYFGQIFEGGRVSGHERGPGYIYFLDFLEARREQISDQIYSAMTISHGENMEPLDSSTDIEESLRDPHKLHIASAKGYYDVARGLLDEGCLKVNDRDEYQNTPLYAASARGHDRVVQLLLSRGANVNAFCQFDNTALYAASAEGHTAVVKLLLQNGADVTAQCEYGATAFHAAAAGDHFEVLQLLFSKPEPNNERTAFSRTSILRNSDCDITDRSPNDSHVEIKVSLGPKSEGEVAGKAKEVANDDFESQLFLSNLTAVQCLRAFFTTIPPFHEMKSRIEESFVASNPVTAPAYQRYAKHKLRTKSRTETFFSRRLNDSKKALRQILRQPVSFWPLSQPSESCPKGNRRLYWDCQKACGDEISVDLPLSLLLASGHDQEEIFNFTTYKKPAFLSISEKVLAFSVPQSKVAKNQPSRARGLNFYSSIGDIISQFGRRKPRGGSIPQGRNQTENPGLHYQLPSPAHAPYASDPSASKYSGESADIQQIVNNTPNKKVRSARDPSSLLVLFVLSGNDNRKVLKSIEIENHESDKDFFEKLRRVYSEVRGWRRWFSFTSIYDIQWVKFHRYDAMQASHSDGLCDNIMESLPHVNDYDYIISREHREPPVPIIRPRGPQEIMDHYNTPHRYANCSAVIKDAIPKKLNGQLTGIRPEGWGIHAVEAICPFMIIMWAIIVNFIPIVCFAPWWLLHHPGDLQNAFVPSQTISIIYFGLVTFKVAGKM